MKYFFLSEGWHFTRVWEEEGLWDITIWRRKPEIKKLNLGILEKGEVLWLYQVEDAILMLEVQPINKKNKQKTSIGQVIIKRLINSEQVIERLIASEKIITE